MLRPFLAVTASLLSLASCGDPSRIDGDPRPSWAPPAPSNPTDPSRIPYPLWGLDEDGHVPPHRARPSRDPRFAQPASDSALQAQLRRVDAQRTAILIDHPRGPVPPEEIRRLDAEHRHAEALAASRNWPQPEYGEARQRPDFSGPGNDNQWLSRQRKTEQAAADARNAGAGQPWEPGLAGASGRPIEW